MITDCGTTTGAAVTGTEKRLCTGVPTGVGVTGTEKLLCNGVATGGGVTGTGVGVTGTEKLCCTGAPGIVTMGGDNTVVEAPDGATIGGASTGGE